MGLCLSHMFFLASSHKKNENQKNFRHIEIMIFTNFFVNSSFAHVMIKKVNSRYNMQNNQSRIIEMFKEYNEK